MRWSSSREKLRNGRLPSTVVPSTGCGGVGLWQPYRKEIENRFDLAIFVKCWLAAERTTARDAH